MTKPLYDRRVKSLQVFRGFAALGVVIHHSLLYTQQRYDLPITFWYHLADSGYLGVDFFFVLSGFIIMYTHIDDPHSLVAAKTYIFKRLARIYPIYLPLSLLMILVRFLFPNLWSTDALNFNIWSSILLIPGNELPALGVGWTLIHEVMFYSLFLLFFISEFWLILALLIWGVSIVVYNQMVIIPETSYLRYPLSPLNIEFMFGVLSAYAIKLYQDKLAMAKWVFTISGIILIVFFYLLISIKGILLLRLGAALAFALLIIGFYLIEKTSRLSWHPVAILIGNASYSIYLVHNPLLSVSSKIMYSSHVYWVVSFIGGICIGLCAGVIYYILFERKVMSYFKRCFA